MSVRHQENIEKFNKLRNIIRNFSDLPTLILGDFNGHLSMIGNHATNENGRMLLNLVEDENLVILNEDLNCKGTFTWNPNHRDQRSVIDYGLVNHNMYQYFDNMIIDEKKLMFDLSDHNMLKIQFNLESIPAKRECFKEYRYYSLDDNSITEFIRYLENKIEQDNRVWNIQTLENYIKEAADIKLLKICKRKSQENEVNPEPKWLTFEIKENIKLREIYNAQKGMQLI